MTPAVGMAAGAADAARAADAAGAAPAPVATPATPTSATRHFRADMAAEWQTRYTASPATGSADFHLDLKTLTLSWTLTYQKLSGPPRSLALYAPAQPGANGAKILDLAPRGSRSPVQGSAVITAAQVQYLLYGWSYVNLATTKFPWGEIRGQLDVRPAQASVR
jgi:hypothetical protein